MQLKKELAALEPGTVCYMLLSETRQKPSKAPTMSIA
jgi:hypothetical protein